MGAERGWIGELQPEKDWHTPGWLSEKGTGRSHFHAGRQYYILPDDPVESLNILREAGGLEPLREED